jgi:hypothetical protein
MVQISFATSTALFLLASNILALPLTEKDVSIDARDVDAFDFCDQGFSYDSNWLKERDAYENIESRMFKAAAKAVQKVSKEVGCVILVLILSTLLPRLISSFVFWFRPSAKICIRKLVMPFFTVGRI